MGTQRETIAGLEGLLHMIVLSNLNQLANRAALSRLMTSLIVFGSYIGVSMRETIDVGAS